MSVLQCISCVCEPTSYKENGNSSGMVCFKNRCFNMQLHVSKPCSACGFSAKPWSTTLSANATCKRCVPSHATAWWLASLKTTQEDRRSNDSWLLYERVLLPLSSWQLPMLRIELMREPSLGQFCPNRQFRRWDRKLRRVRGPLSGSRARPQHRRRGHKLRLVLGHFQAQGQELLVYLQLRLLRVATA